MKGIHVMKLNQLYVDYPCRPFSQFHTHLTWKQRLSIIHAM